MYIEVVIFRNHHRIDQWYTYAVAAEVFEQLHVGARVLVPFGHQGYLEAIVMKKCDVEYKPDFPTKSILYVFDDDIYLTQSDLDVIAKIRDAYLCTFYEAIQLFMPSGTMIEQEWWYKLSIDAIRLKNENALLTHEGLNANMVNLLSQIDAFESVEASKLEGKAMAKNLSKLQALGLIEKDLKFKQIIKDRYKYLYEVTTDLNAFEETIPARYVAQKRAIDFLKKQPKGDLSDLKNKANTPKTVVDKLEAEGVIRIKQVEDLRLPAFMDSEVAVSHTVLNPEQEAVLTGIRQDDVSEEFLIYGVTGSGKTEIYAKLMEDTIAKGQKVIFVLPEISLTPQMVARFVKKFGKERIALLHSKISQGERHDQWKAIRRGEYDIIIGARSAIFAPTDDIGLIVIDEEHEHSYRSDKRPKYDTYEVAIWRAKQYGAKVITGSATPSIEAYYESTIGKRKRFDLKVRYNRMVLPDYQIIDMRRELAEGNKQILSRALYDAIQDRLNKGEQTIIFLNRTGHSTFVTCRSCGFTLDCPNCDVTLTYHKSSNEVKCHYCGYQSYVPKKCPKCGSQYFKYFGVGTEKVEETLRDMFKDAKIARMDKTTTRKKGEIETIISDFELEKTDILIGTQMVTKGFDFKNVTLVGVLSSDLLVHMPFYYAGERAYQLINQVAGRAGRGSKNGEVIIQSYNPDHYALQNIDYDTFYDNEIAYRERLHYPPFYKLINLIFTSKEEKVAESFAVKSHQYLHHQILKKDLQNKVELYAPNPASLKKLDGVYRWQVLLKTNPEAHEVLRPYLLKLQERFDGENECNINIDLNARNVL